MGALALAGMVSGMGQGLERGLQQTQSGLIQYGLQDADRQFQSEKLKLQMEHAERLQQASIGAAASENAKNRDLQSTLHQQTEEWANARNQQQIGGHLTGAAIQAEGAKEAAKAHADSAEKIADMANKTHMDMNAAIVNASKYATDQHLTAALLTSYSESQKALATDINRLETIATDYKQDPNNPVYKAALKDLEAQRKRSYELTIARDALHQAIEREKGITRPASAPEKKFSIPDMGTPSAPPSTSPIAPTQSAVPPQTAPSLTEVQPEDTWKRAGALVPGVTGLANMLRK